MSAPDERETRSRRATAAIVTGDPIDSYDFMALRSRLSATVQRTASGFSETETIDIVDAGIEKLFRASIGGNIEPETALAYLRRIVHNETVDRLRRLQSSPNAVALEEAHGVDELHDEDAIARLIDERATAATVEDLLKAAAERRDFSATKVIGAYLKLAASYGRSPSIRSVAEATKLSHTAVSKILERLRKQLSEEEFPN